MSAGIVAVLVIAAIVVVAIVAGAVYENRRRRLRRTFGPEYDSLVKKHGSRRKAEAELAGREKRVRRLDIRTLDPAARSRYTSQWTSIQENFVDAPQQAVADAQRLVMTVMNQRGYPTDGDGQVIANLSVNHASTLEHHRSAYEINQRAAHGLASTEDLRQAMIHYRVLFQDLLGKPGRQGAASRGPRQATLALESTSAAPRPDFPDDERGTAISDHKTAAAEQEIVGREATVIPRVRRR